MCGCTGGNPARAAANQTKKALWELDNLYRTLYILIFVDDVGLRQSVQKALNRGEAYHRFTVLERWAFLSVKEHRPSQRVASLPFVQASMDALSQFDVLDVLQQK